MRSKDLVNLEEAYQRVVEDYTHGQVMFPSDRTILKPEEVAANEKEQAMREDKTYTLNNIVAAFKQQGNTTVTPIKVENLPKEIKKLYIDGETNKVPNMAIFLIQKKLGPIQKTSRFLQVGTSVKISKAYLLARTLPEHREMENMELGRVNVYMINDVTNKVAFTRQIFDTESLYKVVDEFNKFNS